MIKRLNIKQPKPLQYFKKDTFLEKFTHIKLWHIWALWGPISLIAILSIFYLGGLSQVPMPRLVLTAFGLILAGFIRWTLLEYIVHRFVFHYDGPSKFGRKLAWYSHGIHHAQATLNTRLVIPPIVSLVLGLIIGIFDWLVFAVIANASWMGCALFAGTALGYLFYDTMHWSVHYFDTDWKWYRNLRKNHMRHHTNADKRFGVSNTLWDHVFGTYPKPGDEKAGTKVH